MTRNRLAATLLSLLMALAIAIPPEARAQETRVVVLVRHAEKAEGDDPELSPEGRERSRELARVLSQWPVDAIYTSQFRRTRQTAEPLSAATGVASVVIDARDPGALLERIRNGSDRAVVVVGHSNTVPALARALGAPGVKDIPEEAYDDLLVVTLGKSGEASLLHLKYGAATPY